MKLLVQNQTTIVPSKSAGFLNIFMTKVLFTNRKVNMIFCEDQQSVAFSRIFSSARWGERSQQHPNFHTWYFSRYQASQLPTQNCDLRDGTDRWPWTFRLAGSFEIGLLSGHSICMCLWFGLFTRNNSLLTNYLPAGMLIKNGVSRRKTWENCKRHILIILWQLHSQTGHGLEKLFAAHRLKIPILDTAK